MRQVRVNLPQPTVTILAPRFWPDLYGGVEQRMWHTAVGFSQRSIITHVLTENRTDATPVESPMPGLTIRRLAPMNAGRFWRWQEWLRIAWWRNAIREHASEGSLFATEPISAVAAILAGRKNDVIFNPACCCAAMDLVGRHYPDVTTMRQPRRQIWIDRFAYRHAPAVVVSSENVLDQMRRHYGERPNAYVVAHGVEMPQGGVTRPAARQQWGLADGDFVIGFVGRLDPCKDLGFLFKAVAQADIPHARLLMVGEGPDLARLQSLAAQHGLADRVTWTGKLDQPLQGYAAMDVMVLPSVYEAFGNVIPEAMAAGVPVIGRRRDNDPQRPVLTACQEIIDNGQTGCVVDSHDPADLSRQLTMLARRPALRAAMGSEARRTAAMHTWDRMVKGYIRLLNLSPSSALAKAA